MGNKKLLKIADVQGSTWIYPIMNELNKLDALMGKKYNSSDLGDWGISISTKLDIISALIQNLNNENSKIQKELKENIERVDKCINEEKYYTVKDRKVVILLIAYIECTIFEMKSTYDLLIKYITHFYKDIFGNGIKKSNFLKKCKKEGLNKNWVDFLDNVRNDLIHNYAGWISFKKIDSSFDLMIEMPKLQNMSYKKYKDEYLTRQSVNELSGGFGDFLECTKNIIIKEIQGIVKTDKVSNRGI
jgi:hypothetical protein